MSNEEALDFEELQLPPLSGQAFSRAFAEKLAAGESVLISENGCLVEVFPDGRREFVKSVELPLHFTLGTKIELR